MADYLSECALQLSFKYFQQHKNNQENVNADDNCMVAYEWFQRESVNAYQIAIGLSQQLSSAHSGCITPRAHRRKLLTWDILL